jgi:hypothetical protein
MVVHQMQLSHQHSPLDSTSFDTRLSRCTSQMRCAVLSSILAVRRWAIFRQPSFVLHANHILHRSIFRVTNRALPQQMQRSLFPAGTAMMIQEFTTQLSSTNLCSIHSLGQQSFHLLHLLVPGRRMPVHPRPLQLHRAVETQVEASADWVLGKLLLPYRH